MSTALIVIPKLSLHEYHQSSHYVDDRWSPAGVIETWYVAVEERISGLVDVRVFDLVRPRVFMEWDGDEDGMYQMMVVEYDHLYYAGTTIEVDDLDCDGFTDALHQLLKDNYYE